MIPKVTIEIVTAKSGRAHCKTCEKVIEEDSKKFMHHGKGSYHLQCLPQDLVDEMFLQKPSIEKVKGWKELNESEKKKVKVYESKVDLED